MRPITIAFSNGNRARAVHAPTDTDGAAMAEVLGLPSPRAVLLVNGGAADMSPADVARLRTLLPEGVARVAAEAGLTAIDGGTQAGVMQMFAVMPFCCERHLILLGV